MSTALGDLRDLEEIRSRASDSRIALMLYGSHARGTATATSDVDVLELVDSAPQAYSAGRTNVTQYTPAHLEALATKGSLFVRHLRFEGRVLSDPSGSLAGILASYRPPASYTNLVRQIRVAGGALDPHAVDLTRWTDGLARLGIYLLRTSVYVSRATEGNESFDLGTGLDPREARLLNLRHATRFSAEDVRDLYAALRVRDRGVLQNRLGSVEAYIVAHSTRQDLANLFAPVLGASVGIDYGTLSLPPF